jgi:glucan biosynthesis protein C
MELKTVEPNPRHYEIDALRVLALALLIVYHIFLCYQPFADQLMFLKYDELLDEYWFLGELLSFWRIPLLFVISGMASGFVLRRRTVRELVHDRLMRLVPPLVFGAFVVVPVFPAIYAIYTGAPVRYFPSPGHLWFLINLVSYTILMLPLIIYVKRHPENLLIRMTRGVLPYGLLVILPVPLALETAISRPDAFAFFPVRFWYGFLCYAIGFLLLSVGDKFWNSIRIVCHLALPIAIVFYIARMGSLSWDIASLGLWTCGIESGLWMLAVLGYGAMFLNRPSRLFAYLNKAVFPIYIIHMPMQQLVAFCIFRWKLAPEITFGLHLLLTFVFCGLLYEFVIRRMPWLYPVMGLRREQARNSAAAQTDPAPTPALWPRLGTGLTLYVLSPLVFLAQMALVIAALVPSEPTSVSRGPATGIHQASLQGDMETVQQHIAAGVDIDQRDPTSGNSPLTNAATFGRIEVAQVLLRQGADVNARNNEGSTPLHAAAFFCHTEVVEMLLEHGADTSLRNNAGATALDSVAGPFDQVKPIYDLLGGLLSPLGLELDYQQIKDTRPVIAELLR